MFKPHEQASSDQGTFWGLNMSDETEAPSTRTCSSPAIGSRFLGAKPWGLNMPPRENGSF